MTEQLNLFGGPPARYPDRPGYKSGPGQETSRAAARAIASAASTLREAAYRVIAECGPIGADAVATRLRASVLAVRPRISELAKAGRIVRAAGRCKNESGMSAALWRAVQDRRAAA